MKQFKKLVSFMLSSVFLIGILLCGIAPTISADTSDLLGNIDSNALLGTASGFTVFLEENFAANGSDTEGRIAAGGGANLGTMSGYSAGSKTSNGADVIVGDGPLQNFTTGDRTFVIQNPDGEVSIDGNVTVAQLIDFEAEFNSLRTISNKLATEPINGTVSADSGWSSKINFVGTSSEYNYFTIDSNYLDSQNYFLNFDVPEGSYVIITVYGSDITLYTQLYGTAINGQNINGNDDENNCRILWNLPEATSITLSGSGRFSGSILAPNADVTGPDSDGAHLSGELIAKSYTGNMEFGSLSFTGIIVEQQATETTIETTTTETTTTEITTEPTTTTTTETTTTTTEPTTETTTTTEITTETTTTTTEPTTETTTTTEITTETTTTTTETTTTETTTTETTTTEPTTETTTTEITTETTTTTTETTTTETTTTETTTTEITTETTTTTTETTTTTTETTTIIEKTIIEETTTGINEVIVATSTSSTTATKISSSPKTGDSSNTMSKFLIIGALIIIAINLAYQIIEKRR